MKKIFIITGSRSEFGLIKNLIINLKKIRKFQTRLIVTGSHLSKEHGYTYKEIKNENIKIFKKINILGKSNNKKSNSDLSSISTGIEEFQKFFKKYKPSLVCIPCDRYEMLGPALSAFFLNIPIAHLFGGETTEGSQDETTRHVLTKLSSYHFVTHKTHQKRVIQMGENKNRVFLVGNMTIDNILNTKLYDSSEIKKKITYSNKKNILVTFHPITNIPGETKKQFKNLLAALNKFKNINIIFTKPNSDNGNLDIIKMTKKFIKKNKNAKMYDSLGHKLYYSVLKKVDCVIGNSSSALSEAPYLGAISINVGNRQQNRVQPGRVINVAAKAELIEKKLKLVLIKKIKLKIVDKEYLKQGATKKIIRNIKNIKFNEAIIKNFSDLKFKV
jgi:GDP/UDP-N,N'-diacetylbacillosamine 2-epimerase (hydrolysing)